MKGQVVQSPTERAAKFPKGHFMSLAGQHFPRALTSPRGVTCLSRYHMSLAESDVSRGVTCFSWGQMSLAESYVSHGVAILSQGHMSLVG